jgi:hypothetical protein
MLWQQASVVVLTAAHGTGGNVCKAGVVYKAGQGLQTMASLAEETKSGGRQMAGTTWRWGGRLKRNEQKSDAGAGARMSLGIRSRYGCRSWPEGYKQEGLASQRVCDTHGGNGPYVDESGGGSERDATNLEGARWAVVIRRRRAWQQ